MVRRLKTELPPRWDGPPYFGTRELDMLPVTHTDEERLAHAKVLAFARTLTTTDQLEAARAMLPEPPMEVFGYPFDLWRVYLHPVQHRVAYGDFSGPVRVTGRSERLTLNYRTTAEILGWSIGLLHGQPVDDLNGDLDTLAGCRSDVHGRPPVLHAAPTRQEELDKDAVTHELDLQQERCLLFVACTRARETLRVSWHSEPSVLLPSS